MNSKNWKSLMFASALALSLTACGNSNEQAPPASPYSGMWANSFALQKYRENKANPNGFCEYVYAWINGEKVDGRKIDLKLHPYVIQTSNEVFLYSSVMSMNQSGYREIFFQGVVKDDGQFFMGGTNTGFQSAGLRKVDLIQDRSRFSVDQNRTVLTVYKSRKNYYFLRTEPGEMDAFLAARTTCEDNYYQNKANQNDRTEEGNDNHDDGGQTQIPQETEFDLQLGS